MAPGFGRPLFPRELEKTADVERVVDQAFVSDGTQAPPSPVAVSGEKEAPPSSAPDLAPQRQAFQRTRLLVSVEGICSKVAALRLLTMAWCSTCTSSICQLCQLTQYATAG